MQDIFVLAQLDFKHTGFFVEFGPANGVHFSNTYSLEKTFGWNGILAKPFTLHYQELMRNRNCHIENICVGALPGRL
ncbi:hypothetical protein ICN48_13180 [Polynucleobacter sp. JS-Safj-400b-B2]|uniref:hypothetical protein n=1 Tax=Polynucleobacter sp. JS-Safj-400b-B2 TaxID=2576921 RepID=UPI001C0AF2DB|nr:hypothetical protein [Polynucleobacter sp. JS-Safj-400b-B2]MBU3627178.1 hypothetical protein [Polynucleobacter sp. JS-Safj-400b-B2]